MKKRILRSLFSALLAMIMTVSMAVPVFAESISMNDVDQEDDQNAELAEESFVFNGHTYQEVEETLCWSEAKEKCEKLGGHLVTITSKEEQEFIETMNSAYLWIGGYREGNEWRWVTGEPWDYTNWAEGEPNNSSNVVSNENCIVLWPYKWNDLADTNTFEQNGYIIEWDYDIKDSLIQKALFPLERISVTQGRYTEPSHAKQNAMDFGYKDALYAYAPFDGTIVETASKHHAIWFQSNNKVKYADGTEDYMTVLFMHGYWDDPVVTKGKSYSQGDKIFKVGGFGNTPKYNDYAAHFHIEVIRGQKSGWTARGNVNLEDAFYVNEDFTTIRKGGGFDWKTTDGKTLDNDKAIKEFVARMYVVALGRAAEKAGMDDWSKQLSGGKSDGATLARGFMCGAEFKNKGLSNELYVRTLYHTFFDREPDKTGLSGWVSALEGGASRESVLAGFVNSQEFANLCDDYGIARGTMEDDGSSIYNAGVRDFVLRNYEKALKREGETQGVEDWTHRINTGLMSALDVAQNFFHSEEFYNMNTTDDEYVEILYETFLGRESEAGGKAYWVNQLKAGKSRDEVMEGFAYSKEFHNIMAQYGL